MAPRPSVRSRPVTDVPWRASGGSSSSLYQEALPDGRKWEAQRPYGPFQVNGTTFSNPSRIHLPIKPAQTLPTKKIDTALFDASIYAQPGASSPPPGVALPAFLTAPPSQQQKDEPLYPQPHSVPWHAAKQAEIQARGRKKANFGRAAQSLRRQHQQQRQGGEDLDETLLPEKIAENPVWMRALRRLRGSGLTVQDGSGADLRFQSPRSGKASVRVPVDSLGGPKHADASGHTASRSIEGSISKEEVSPDTEVVKSVGTEILVGRDIDAAQVARSEPPPPAPKPVAEDTTSFDQFANAPTIEAQEDAVRMAATGRTQSPRGYDPIRDTYKPQLGRLLLHLLTTRPLFLRW